LPLNPPSFSGQDVWYSPSVYANQVPVALWQPAVPQPSALHSLPTIPSPKFEFTQQQINMAVAPENTSWYITEANGNVVSVPPGTPGATAEGTPPSPDAAPGQMDGQTTTISDAAAAGQGGYSALIGNLNKVLQEGKSGAWRGGPSNPNLQKMFSTIGITPSQCFPAGHSYWCAAFMAWMLKISGLQYTIGSKSQAVSIKAPDYATYGQGIDPGQPNLWRKGDVLLVKPGGAASSSSGNHVTFLWRAPFRGSKGELWYPCLGGNQGNTPGDVSIANFTSDSIIHIGRTWPDSGVALTSV